MKLKVLFTCKEIDKVHISQLSLPYFIEFSAHFFYMENDAEIFSVHYKWNVTEKGLKMAFMMNKLAIINNCEIIL
jgi:hypothetical protein